MSESQRGFFDEVEQGELPKDERKKFQKAMDKHAKKVKEAEKLTENDYTFQYAKKIDREEQMKSDTQELLKNIDEQLKKHEGRSKHNNPIYHISNTKRLMQV